MSRCRLFHRWHRWTDTRIYLTKNGVPTGGFNSGQIRTCARCGKEQSRLV